MWQQTMALSYCHKIVCVQNEQQGSEATQYRTCILEKRSAKVSDANSKRASDDWAVLSWKGIWKLCELHAADANYHLNAIVLRHGRVKIDTEVSDSISQMDHITADDEISHWKCDGVDRTLNTTSLLFRQHSAVVDWLLDVQLPTLTMQSSVWHCGTKLSAGWHEPPVCVSSAKRCGNRCGTRLQSRDQMCTEWTTKGLRTDPCGTLYRTSVTVDR